VGGHIRTHEFMESNPNKYNSVVWVDNLLNLKIHRLNGITMTVLQALINGYEKSNLLMLNAHKIYTEHLETCLDPKCCARCENLSLRVLVFDTELEILLEDIKALRA